MKKFTSVDIVSEKYANSDSVRNDIYKLIESTLHLNNEDPNLEIVGKEDLVEKIVEFLSKKTIEKEISILERVADNPALIKEEDTNIYDKDMNNLINKVNEALLD